MKAQRETLLKEIENDMIDFPDFFQNDCGVFDCALGPLNQNNSLKTSFTAPKISSKVVKDSPYNAYSNVNSHLKI